MTEIYTHKIYEGYIPESWLQKKDKVLTKFEQAWLKLDYNNDNLSRDTSREDPEKNILTKNDSTDKDF